MTLLSRISLRPILSTAMLASAVVVLSAGCGSRRPGVNNQLKNLGEACSTGIECLSGACVLGACTNPSGGELNDPCADPSECKSGVCTGGFCAEPMSGDTNAGGTACTDSNACGSGEFCHFPSVSPWVMGTEGTCEANCTGTGDCFPSQECLGGVCYTNVDCDPANNSSDCPPGEVCNAQTRTCSAPPSTCFFNEQCPAGWLCNVDNTCIDPNAVNLGSCTMSTDCDALAACPAGACTCDNGECRPLSGCSDTNPCPDASYCAGGTCQAAPECTSDNDCTPFSLKCNTTTGYCVNPDPCDSSGMCPMGQECNENLDPPGCLSQGCSRDEQCGTGEYCDTFTATCTTGCRGDADCAGQCGGAMFCGCAFGECYDDPSLGVGQACNDSDDCPGGTVCAPNETDLAILCGFVGGGIPLPGIDCSQSCRVVCNRLTAAIQDTCPPMPDGTPTECGGGGGLLEGLIMDLFGSLFSMESSASVCYETSSTAP